MKYRVSTYQDGHGNLIYRAEFKCKWWPFWFFAHGYTGWRGRPEILEYRSREEAMQWVEREEAGDRERVRKRVG